MSHHEKSNTEVEHQFQQSAANKMQNNVHGADKREDSDRANIEQTRRQQEELHKQSMKFADDKHEQAMSEKRFHNENMRHGLNKLINLDPSEAKAQSEVLSGVQIEAIKSIVVEAVSQAVNK